MTTTAVSGDDGVLIAIDWENIRRGAQMYHQTVTPRALCDAMKTVGEVFGEVRGGKAFGDWSLRREDGASFSLAGIEPYNAPRTMAGKDRTDPSIILEVYDWIRDREDCRFIVLGSGDSDYQALVDRAQNNGRRIIICAFSQSVARDMLAVAPLFPLEAELGFPYARTRHPAQPGRNPANLPGFHANLRPPNGPPGKHPQLRRLQQALHPVDDGLGHRLHRVRMLSAHRPVAL